MRGGNNMGNDTLIIGMGEIGQPLATILKTVYDVETRDKEDMLLRPTYDWIHICFPYSNTFVEDVVQYARYYQARYVIIHSTVFPGTTARIGELLCWHDTIVAYSPVRGRHRSMAKDMIYYTKYVACPYSVFEEDAVERYLAEAGFDVCIIRFESTSALETAKLVETSYSALLIAWAQELERIAQALEVDREDLLELTKDVPYLPRYVFEPGRIGEHCLIPNIELLQQVHDGVLLDAIIKSNEQVPDNGVRRRARQLW